MLLGQYNLLLLPGCGSIRILSRPHAPSRGPLLLVSPRHNNQLSLLQLLMSCRHDNIGGHVERAVLLLDGSSGHFGRRLGLVMRFVRHARPLFHT